MATYTHELLHLLALHALLELALLIGIESESKYLPSASMPSTSPMPLQNRRMIVQVLLTRPL